MAYDQLSGGPLNYGYGDTELGAKYRFINPGEDDWWPQVAVVIDGRRSLSIRSDSSTNWEHWLKEAFKRLSSIHLHQAITAYSIPILSIHDRIIGSLGSGNVSWGLAFSIPVFPDR